MERYGSTESFKNTVKNIQRLSNYRKSVEYLGQDEENNPMLNIITDNPIIKFTGFVKLHGSNGSILRKNVFDNNGKVVETKQQFCSRERVLSFGHDNFNFWETYQDKDLDFLFSQIKYTNYCQIYGEVCGTGVQQNVAISELPRMFVVFAIKADGVWLNIDDYNLENEELRIFQINHPRFKRYEITIDFNNPNQYEEELEKMVEEVEAECPVGKAFGVSGTGEGLVFINEDRSVFFKVKGDKHSGGNKKVRVSAGIERADLTQFLVLALTEARLQQGIQYLKEMELPVSKASTPHYLKWVVEDVFKEETSVIEENGLLDKAKQIRQELSDIARRWFFKTLDNGK